MIAAIGIAMMAIGFAGIKASADPLARLLGEKQTGLLVFTLIFLGGAVALVASLAILAWRYLP